MLTRSDVVSLASQDCAFTWHPRAFYLSPPPLPPCGILVQNRCKGVYPVRKSRRESTLYDYLRIFSLVYTRMCKTDDGIVTLTDRSKFAIQRWYKVNFHTSWRAFGRVVDQEGQWIVQFFCCLIFFLRTNEKIRSDWMRKTCHVGYPTRADV